jgi:hypothetical protein
MKNLIGAVLAITPALAFAADIPSQVPPGWTPEAPRETGGRNLGAHPHPPRQLQPMTLLDGPVAQSFKATDEANTALHEVISAWYSMLHERMTALAAERDYWRAWAGYDPAASEKKPEEK